MIFFKDIFVGNFKQFISGVMMLASIMAIYLLMTYELNVASTDLSKVMLVVDDWITASYFRGV